MGLPLRSGGYAFPPGHPGLLLKDGLPSDAGGHSRMRGAGGREGARGTLEQPPIICNWRGNAAVGENIHSSLHLKVTSWHKASPKGLIPAFKSLFGLLWGPHFKEEDDAYSCHSRSCHNLLQCTASKITPVKPGFCSDAWFSKQLPHNFWLNAFSSRKLQMQRWGGGFL